MHAIMQSRRLEAAAEMLCELRALPLCEARLSTIVIVAHAAEYIRVLPASWRRKTFFLPYSSQQQQQH
jgi:hypothetical protein